MSASRSWWPKRRDAVALAAVLACLPLSAPAPAAAAAQVPTTQTTLTCEALPDDDWCEEWVIAAHLRDDGAKGLGLSAELSRDGRQLFMMSYRSCPFGSSCVDSQHVAVAAFDTATGERLWSASRWLSPDGSKPGVVSFPKLAVNPDASKVFVVATEVTDTGAKAGGRWTQTTVTLAYNAVAPRSPGDPALGDLLWTDRMDVASDATKAEIEDSTGEGVAVTPDGSTVLVLAVSRSPAWGTGGGPAALLTTAYDATSGERLWTETYGDGFVTHAQSIAVSPDGAAAYVTGEVDPGGLSDTTATTVAYRVRGESAGRRLWVATDPEANKGMDVAVSDDGARVFMIGADVTESGSRITTAAYDAASGSLIWNAAYEGGPGFNQPTDSDHGNAVAVSPDDELVFVTGAAQDADRCPDPDAGCQIPVLAYDQVTGALRWTQTYMTPSHDETAGTDVAISPDGGLLYVAGYASGQGQVALALDGKRGLHVARSAHANDDPTNMAGLPSPDGRRVYFVSEQSDLRTSIVSRLVPRAADLSLSAAASRDAVRVGETLTYRLTVANAGPEDALGATLQAHLPDGVEFVSADAPSGRCDGAAAGTVTCWLDSVSSGSSATVEFAVVAKKTGTLITSAEVRGSKPDPAPTDTYVTEATVVEGDGPPATTTGALAAAIREPATGANVSHQPDAPLTVAGAVRFEAPEPSKTTTFYTRGCSGGALTQKQGALPCQWEDAVGEDEEQFEYTTQANDGVPLTLDASRSIEGAVTMTTYAMTHTVTGHTLHSCHGEMTFDLTVTGVRIGESTVRTLATAAQTVTIPAIRDTASGHHWPVSWTAPTPTAMNRSGFSSLSLSVVVRRPESCMMSAELTIPNSASGERRVEVSVDDGPFTSNRVAVADDLTTWSGVIPTLSVGRHVIRARAVQGGETSPADTHTITITNVDQPARPNLTLTDLGASQERPKQTTLTATVANSGDAEASGVVVRFTDGDTVIGDSTPVDVAKGESKTVSVGWDTRKAKGDHVITAVVDPGDTVVESDESDNTITRTVTVRGNRVENGSFETSSSGSSPDGWSGSSSGAGYDSSGQHASDGTDAVSVTGTGQPASLSNPAWTSAPIPVTAGESYNLAVTVATEGVSSAPSLRVVYLDAAGKVLDAATGITTTAVGDTAATQVLGGVTVPEGVTQVRVELVGFAPTDLATSGTVWFDDVWLW